ncbi:hypothetical protein BMR05_05530 [Methylococcaceae bacterium HT4]|nr:hypothetical protein BMR05_05530 [Methylococcaceae bacterium HT4]TXL18860.1 hypothetical protein BMR06_12795 [Methylococcaceae bacterium HT5]
MSKQTSIPGMEEHDLEDQASVQLSSAHYKEAIRLFKKLLQTDDKDEWRQKLAYCYVQRAMQFATRGMYKEALVLWENHVQYTQAPYDANDQYIFWLIQTSNQAKIHTNLGDLSAQQLDKQYPSLATVLGLLMLTEHPEFEQYLPQDSVFIAQFKIVQTALQAYQGNDSNKLNKALKLLPYRSAFRDFRTLLNAVVLMPSSVEQAKSLLTKIPAHSAYFQAARILLVCTKEGSELAEELVQLSHQQCAVASEIRGLNKKQQDFIQHYSQQHDKLTDKVQFKMAIQFQPLLGNEFAQSFCQSLLASYPAGKKDFNKHFSKSSEFEENRIKALSFEQDNNFDDAEFYWRLCFNELSDKYSDNSLKRALILRHMAVRESDEEGRAELLEESLDYDPGDRQSYLQIIQYYSQQSETEKEYKKWLAITLKQFPQDVEVLTQAVKTATRNKTYKKASQYATKILKIDPLNTFAKQILFSSHLAHARGLMREKKYRLVEKEISQAEKLNIGKVYQKQIRLMRALLCFANEDKQQGMQRIVAELAVLHTDPVNGHFRATMEAQLNGLPVATVLRELPSIKQHLLSAQELTELIRQVGQYATGNNDQVFSHKALEKIKAPLKKSLSEHEYTEELFLNLCKVLDSIEHFELLRHCVKSTPLKWNKPIWMYYQVYADTNGDARECSNWQIQRLQIANDQARDDKDYPTAMLIDKLLESYFEANPQGGFGIFDELFGGFDLDDDDDDEFYDPMEEIFAHLDEDVLLKLNEKAELIMKKLTPEKLIQGVMKKVGNNEGILMAIMQNPDILSALMILRAADELKLNIEVDIDDVINMFDINDNKTPFPCPF